MKEQTIKINVPEGKRAIYDESTQTIRFVDVDPKSRSWEEFCKNHPAHVDIKEYFISSAGSIIGARSNVRYPNNLASKEDAEGILAFIQLTRLHDEWVGKQESGLYGIFYNKKTTSLIVTQEGENPRFLSFPTITMAKEFLDSFPDLLWKAKRFL